MTEIRYSREHEWVRVDGDIATIGISNFAQEQLGDVVFVELPEPGAPATRDGEIAVVESVKAASEVYAPVTGEVVEVNALLEDDPGMVNSSAEEEGWFLRIRLSDAGELEHLMDDAAYAAYTAGLD